MPIAAIPALTIASIPGRLEADTYPIRITRRIRWSDIQDGRVSRVGMAHFFEDLRIFTIHQFDAARGTQSQNGSSLLRAVTIEHLAPATPDFPTLELAVGVASIGKSSFTYALAAFQNGRCVAVGSSVDVRVVDGRAAAWDDDSLAVLQKFLIPAASGAGTATAPAQQPATYPWSFELDTRFADTDCNGHLNNVTMSRYHDNAAMAFIREALGHTHPDAQGLRLSVVRQEASMGLQTHYSGPIKLCVAVLEIQPQWFTLAIATVKDGEHTTTATALIACLDKDDQPQALPGALVEKLRAFCAPA